MVSPFGVFIPAHVRGDFMAKTYLQKEAGKAYRGMVALNQAYLNQALAEEDMEFFEAFPRMMEVIKRLME